MPTQLEQCKKIYFGSPIWVLFFYSAYSTMCSRLFNMITCHSLPLPPKVLERPPISITRNSSICLTGVVSGLTKNVPKPSPTIISNAFLNCNYPKISSNVPISNPALSSNSPQPSKYVHVSHMNFSFPFLDAKHTAPNKYYEKTMGPLKLSDIC